MVLNKLLDLLGTMPRTIFPKGPTIVSMDETELDNEEAVITLTMKRPITLHSEEYLEKQVLSQIIPKLNENYAVGTALKLVYNTPLIKFAVNAYNDTCSIQVTDECIHIQIICAGHY